MKVVQGFVFLAVFSVSCLAQNDLSKPGPMLLWPPEISSLFQRFVDGFQQYISNWNFLNPSSQSGPGGQSQSGSGCGQNLENGSSSPAPGSSSGSESNSEETTPTVHPAARRSHKGVNKHLHGKKHAHHEEKKKHERIHSHDKQHQNGFEQGHHRS